MSGSYTHTELDREVNSIAGYYTPQKEVRLGYDGREILYIVGQAAIESSCCAAGQWMYALVPGFIVSWQRETNPKGLPVSEVEPIRDKRVQNEVSRLIKEHEGEVRIEFW